MSDTEVSAVNSAAVQMDGRYVIMSSELMLSKCSLTKPKKTGNKYISNVMYNANEFVLQTPELFLTPDNKWLDLPHKASKFYGMLVDFEKMIIDEIYKNQEEWFGSPFDKGVLEQRLQSVYLAPSEPETNIMRWKYIRSKRFAAYDYDTKERVDIKTKVDQKLNVNGLLIPRVVFGKRWFHVEWELMQIRIYPEKVALEIIDDEHKVDDQENFSFRDLISNNMSS